MGVRWGVRGVSRIEHKRKDFKHEHITTDPITGEQVGVFPVKVRLQRQLLQVPFALAAASLLGALIATCFGIEVFISEVYSGPLKSVLVSSVYASPMEYLLILSGFHSHRHSHDDDACVDRHPH